MARRSPSISDDGRLLESLKAVRAETVRAQAGLVIAGDAYQALDRFRGEVDAIAELVTGSREALWPKPHKAE
jgi:hypothetical protein